MTDIASSVRGDRARIFQDLSQLVGFASVHNEPGHEQANKDAAAWVAAALSDAAFSVESIPTTDGSIAVLGNRPGDEGAKTVLLYSHYDVVPAGDPAAWESDPFTLTERAHADGTTRWFGRGAADCKGNVAAHLAALRAVEEAGGTKLNLKFLVEGSEERGGAGLSALIEERPELFAADAILIVDAGNSAVGQPTLTTSLRGGGQVRVKVTTAESAVHSGQFGGAAPDAVKALMRTLDSLTDEYGRTVIDGVECRDTWDGQGYPADNFRADAQLLDGVAIAGEGSSEGATETEIASMLWSRPAVSVIGFTSTPVSEAVNAVANVAEAALNLRVPAHMSAADTEAKLIEHLKNHVPWGAHIEITSRDANQGFATDPELPAARVFAEAFSEAYGTETTAQGMGGSIPLTTELQEKYPNAEIILYGVEEPKAVIHSANESVDPTEIEAVAIAEALFLTRF